MKSKLKIDAPKGMTKEQKNVWYEGLKTLEIKVGESGSIQEQKERETTVRTLLENIFQTTKFDFELGIMHPWDGEVSFKRVADRTLCIAKALQVPKILFEFGDDACISFKVGKNTATIYLVS